MCVYSFSQSCLILCDLMGCSLSGSSVHGIFQTRILEWVAISSSRGSFPPRDGTRISCFSCIAGKFFTTEPHQGSPAMYIYIYTHSYVCYLPTFLPTYYTGSTTIFICIKLYRRSCFLPLFPVNIPAPANREKLVPAFCYPFT